MAVKKFVRISNIGYSFLLADPCFLPTSAVVEFAYKIFATVFYFLMRDFRILLSEEKSDWIFSAPSEYGNVASNLY
jgi:hypothetical protein